MTLFSQDRSSLRSYFLDVWAKRRARTPLEPLESLVAGVIEDHPEYHALLERGEAQLDREFPPEGGMENPFLHMAMHIAIREQVATDRPPGVRKVHSTLSGRAGSPVEAEHRMIECLAESLWTAQRAGTLPDEQAYLDCVSRLVRS
ncbi:MAG: DUF1841 family protein [Gammaproteobacteria bacterium]